ncbi:uncharacterized protein B0T23DRAFT_404380 [Neurospora hispaniola]|uniref:Uncharacterized protein n=1 Tax=Neurospora hispaniola TaxID=588809 RepID=A0AAJ0MR52_9PEZI|nr:hypothetical protein B0T23DRAFT_404380 [Neurospora hispaniola]
MACSVWVTSLRGSETWEGGETSGVGDLFGAGQHKGRKDGWRIKTAGSRDPERQQQAVGQQMGQGVEVVRNGCHGHGKGRYKEWTGAEIMEDVLRALPELRDKSNRRRTGSDRPFLALTEVRVQVLSWRGSKGANRAGRDWGKPRRSSRRVRKEGGERGRRKAGRTRAASHDGDAWRRRRRRRRPGRRTQVITNVSVNVHFLSACPSLVCSISFRLSVTYLPPESALRKIGACHHIAKHMKVRMVGGQCSWILNPCR